MSRIPTFLAPPGISPAVPTFICPPQHHVFTVGPKEEYCHTCGVVRDLVPVALPKGRLDGEYTLRMGMESTVMGRRPDLVQARDGNGKRIPHDHRHSFMILNYRNHRTRDVVKEHQETFVRIWRYVNQAVEGLSLPSFTKYDAVELLRRATPSNLLSGIAVPDRVAGAMYVVLRSKRWDIAVPMSDIHRVISEAKSKSSFATAKKLREFFHLADRHPSFVSHLRYYAGADKLGLSREEGRAAEKILENPEITDGNWVPSSLIAAVVYMVATGWGLPNHLRPSVRRSQESIARACGTTQVTIRTVMNQILDRQAQRIGETLRKAARQERQG